jgi:hypothetical protein
LYWSAEMHQNRFWPHINSNNTKFYYFLQSIISLSTQTCDGSCHVSNFGLGTDTDLYLPRKWFCCTTTYRFSIVDRIYYGFLLVSSDMSKTYLLFGSLCLEFLPNSSFCTRDEFNKIEKILGGGHFVADVTINWKGQPRPECGPVSQTWCRA